jgi:hypothetical protein
MSLCSDVLAREIEIWDKKSLQILPISWPRFWGEFHVRWCPVQESNLHGSKPMDPKSIASANSANRTPLSKAVLPSKRIGGSKGVKQEREPVSLTE